MKKLVIGIDIGGINTVLGLVDRTGEVYARSSFRTAEYPFSTTIRLMSKCSYGRCGSFVRRCLPGLYCRVSGSVLRMPTIIRAGSSVRSISGSFDPESRIRRKGGGFSRFARRSATLSRDSRPYYQRRQCRRSRGDRLRQCRGNAGFHHGNAWNRVGIGIRCRRSDDLRARWHGRRAGACRRRTRRTAMRLRTPWLSGNLCFCDGCQTDGLRVDGPGNGAERFTRCTLRQVRRPDNYRSGAKG